MSEPLTAEQAEALEGLDTSGGGMRPVFYNVWFDPDTGPPEGETWVWVNTTEMAMAVFEQVYVRRLSVPASLPAAKLIETMGDMNPAHHSHERPEIHGINPDDYKRVREDDVVLLRQAIETSWQVNKQWIFRVNRQLIGPVSKGKFCDWCKCANCQGDEHMGVHMSHIELADGTHMCDVCYQYPPCGQGDDCTEFRRTGHCSHRPNLAEGAKWIEWKEGQPCP